MQAKAIAIGTVDSGSGVRVTHRIRRIARQLLPPIVTEPMRRALDERRSSGLPDWEYCPAGWPDGDPNIHGWDVESVLAIGPPSLKAFTVRHFCLGSASGKITLIIQDATRSPF
jgi:hypothetical protein